MRRGIAPAFALAAALAGCQSAKPKSGPAEQALDAKLADVDQKQTQRWTETKEYLQERETKIRDLEDDVSSLKKEVNILRFQVQTLLSARGGGDGTPKGEIPDAVVSGLDAAQRIDQGLAALQAKEGREEAVAADFQPLGQPGVDALLRELRASVRNRDTAYQARIEGVLGRLTPAYVVPSVAPLLEDASLRVPAARILGRTGQASAVPALKKHLNDRGGDVQLAIAEALVALRCEEGIPVLIGALESDATEVRVLACDALKRATGLTHDYRIYASPAENGRAIEAWKAWWKEYGPTYRLPENNGR